LTAKQLAAEKRLAKFNLDQQDKTQARADRYSEKARMIEAAQVAKKQRIAEEAQITENRLKNAEERLK